MVNVNEYLIHFGGNPTNHSVLTPPKVPAKDFK